ncbi:MAG: DUF2905 domain-containing protein [Cyanobium sp. ELA712]|jgi:hypothetical protein
MTMQRLLITIGAALLVVGLLWPLISSSGLGRLPGDINIQRPGLQIYFPFTSGLLVSAGLTLVLWLLRR